MLKTGLVAGNKTFICHTKALCSFFNTEYK